MMDTLGETEAAALLRDFHFVNPTWEGSAFVPFWESELDVAIDPDDEGITPRQLVVLRAILRYSRDLRPDFERALFAYYQADVDGTYCDYDAEARPIPGSGSPKLTEPSQIWGLIDSPVVCIPSYFRSHSAIEFELSFNCEWDREHGLGVLYRDWMPVEFGGWRL
jgi:hypothetical protein